jgi:hypothetical protein
MANYTATSRTSYAKMAGDAAFIEWAESISGATVVTNESEEHGTLYGLLFDQDDCGTIPASYYDEDADVEVDFNIFEEIQEHLAPGWGISFVEAGHEKHRYVVGTAIVVTRDAVESWSTGRFITEKMTQAGALCTRPEY